MCKSPWIPLLGLAVCLTTTTRLPAQSAPYIGFVYPAGGQQGTTTEVRLGGQRIDGLRSAVVSGEGVSATVAQFYRKLSNQEVTLLREQLRDLRREVAQKKKAKQTIEPETEAFIARLETRIGQWVNRPACDALSSIAVLKVTIDPDAEPGAREIRLIGSRGVTNPMAFHVGQVPEYSRRPMITSAVQVLGKESLAQRKRPPEEAELEIQLPCTVNGQIASGEINSYRFEALEGQKLVVSVKARDLIPYIADAVPGWFQPVVTIYDADGKEVAFQDDYRFKPDPILYFEVPADGEYRLAITDAIYRGREDFVYRITIGELPFVTSVFPLGGRLKLGQAPDAKPARGMPEIELRGWNLPSDVLALPSFRNAKPGVVSAVASRDKWDSNSVKLMLGTLPECFDTEPNDVPDKAQSVKSPVIVNGRIDRPDDWDVFQIAASVGDTLVAEVQARRLDSPLDSILKVTDADGRLITFNDDHMDAAAGLNTHHADSYVSVTLPADGKYYVHLGDAARDGGEAFAYRLRISPPRPDFALRVVPSSVNMRPRGAAPVTIYAIRRDGFDGPIRLGIDDLPRGLLVSPVTLKAGETSVRLIVRNKRGAMESPVSLTVVGRATIGGREVARNAVPAEDRMQAFLWRHLVPAQDLQAMVVNPSFQPPPQRPRPPKLKPTEVSTEPVKFTKQQVAGRLRQLDLLFDEWLLTDDFYARKVAQCEVYDSKPLAANKK